MTISAQHVVEDACALWSLRSNACLAPNTRLTQLIRFDERLQAYLDLASVKQSAAKRVLFEDLGREGYRTRGIVFVATQWAFLRGEHGDLDAMIAHVAARSFLPELIASLAMADQALALGAARNWWRDGSPDLMSVAVGAHGARRIDPGALLTDALRASPLVRARAYRTTGQLGRRDLLPQLRAALTDPDPECRFWSAWAAARMGVTEPLTILADITWNNLPRADRALDLLLRRLDVKQANDWLRELAKLPNRERRVIRATGVIGDPFYIPWLIERMAEPATARLAGEAFSMITGLDLAYRDLDRRPPTDFQSGPNDDPADENVALDEDENLPWPDPARIGQWWVANRARFTTGTPCFLGAPKEEADWLEALSDAFQRQRHAAALELAIRQPDKAMFEVRARGRLQRQLLAKARGLA